MYVYIYMLYIYILNTILYCCDGGRVYDSTELRPSPPGLVSLRLPNAFEAAKLWASCSERQNRREHVSPTVEPEHHRFLVEENKHGGNVCFFPKGPGFYERMYTISTHAAKNHLSPRTPLSWTPSSHLPTLSIPKLDFWRLFRKVTLQIEVRNL